MSLKIICIWEFLLVLQTFECLFEITWQSSRHLKFSKSKAKLSVPFPSLPFPQYPHLNTRQLHFPNCSDSKTNVIHEIFFFFQTSFFFLIPVINQQNFKILFKIQPYLTIFISSSLNNSSSILDNLHSSPLLS